MSWKNTIAFSLVFLILGFMLALHFQDSLEEDVRETRDMWEIRMQLQNEQNAQQLLQNQLNELKSTLALYQSSSEQDQINALNESIDMLEKKAGLTEINDPGIIIQLVPRPQDESSAITDPELTPELLNRLINELNSFGATHIAIENERFVNLTAIRYVGDHIYMNQRRLSGLPLTVKVTSDTPDRLFSYMEVSQSRDEFAFHDIELKLEKTDDVQIPAYVDSLNLQYVEVIEDDKAGVN